MWTSGNLSPMSQHGPPGGSAPLVRRTAVPLCNLRATFSLDPVKRCPPTTYSADVRNMLLSCVTWRGRAKALHIPCCRVSRCPATLYVVSLKRDGGVHKSGRTNSCQNGRGVESSCQYGRPSVLTWAGRATEQRPKGLGPNRYRTSSTRTDTERGYPIAPHWSVTPQEYRLKHI